MGSISHHITPLVINNLRGGHIHTHTLTFADKSNTKKPGSANIIPHTYIHYL